MKLVPVILISTCCMRRRYSAAEYVAASLMIISAALFGLGEAKVEPDFNILGLVLSFACLMAQAVQNNLQDHALRDYSVSSTSPCTRQRRRARVGAAHLHRHRRAFAIV